MSPRETESENGHSALQAKNAHVLMIPHPTQPHILPMLDLAYQLVKCGGNNITVTFVSFKPLIDRLKSPSDAIHMVGVSDDLPGFTPPSDMMTADPMDYVFRHSAQAQHNLEPVLLDKKTIQGPTCLVSDFVCSWAMRVAAKLDIPGYVLVVNPGCAILRLLTHRAEGDRHGFRKAHVARFQMMFKAVKESHGILLNTCSEVEGKVIDTLRKILPGLPVLPIGPLGQSPASPSKSASVEGLTLSDDALVMNWLDQHPPLSVLYVCFGTSGMRNLAKRHVQELARGLEMSQQPFMWVLRAPPDVQDIEEVLPPGFEERVKGRGLLVRGWAPQLQILAHRSTGAFLGACGWNSSLESLAQGIPIIGWPSFADQPIICIHMVTELQVAMALRQDLDHFVEAEEIAKKVKAVLQTQQGTDLRENAAKYKTLLVDKPSPKDVQQFLKLIQPSS